MVVFRCNENISKEEYDRWHEYISTHWENKEPILLPESFEVFEFEEGEEIEYEEE